MLADSPRGRPPRPGYRDRDGVSRAPPLKKVFAPTGQELSVARVNTDTFFDNVVNHELDSQGGEVLSSDEEEGFQDFQRRESRLEPMQRATHRDFNRNCARPRFISDPILIVKIKIN